MIGRAIRLLRIELTVTDLEKATAFYTAALGFKPDPAETAPPETARLRGAHSIAQRLLHRGNQAVLLQQFEPQGQAYPPHATACDQVFQHFAIPVTGMAESYARLAALGVTPISNGPQHLPPGSGGARAFKFRDPDGHPLELIQFPDGHIKGIDHAAITVADTQRSIAFYRDQLGLTLAASQTNKGPEQDDLDGLRGVEVEVVALHPAHPTPHIELLGYRNPPVRLAPLRQPSDVAATRLVLEIEANASGPTLIHDPDGHALILLPTG